MSYLHQKNIAHRDIKLENVLISRHKKNGNIKIKLTDFGFATYYSPEVPMTKSLGSRYYMAPELLDQKNYSEKVDVWAASVVAYILLVGDMPFYGKTGDDIRQAIKDKDIEKTLKSPKFSKISKEGKDFIRKGMEV